jgi:hypothetical protein
MSLLTLEKAAFLHGLVQEFLPGRVEFGEIEHALWFAFTRDAVAGDES